MIDIPPNELSVPPLELGKYRHFKGGLYEVVGAALHSETLEPYVVYKALYDNPVKLWVRPYTMFIEYTTVDGELVKRFTKIDNA
jgi:hypothetical protein